MGMNRSPIRAVMRLVLACLMLASPASSMAANAAPLTLASFGAAGDDRTDDTQALRKAFGQAAGRCLDGEGRTYRVRGTLRAGTDFCLANARLRQDVAAFDTRAWITGTCRAERDAKRLTDCGDPAMPDRLPDGLEDYLYTRTLLIRPDNDGAAPIMVALRNVTVDRGTDPASGARSDAAGIWIANAARMVLADVTVTGGGKGFGIMIVNSSNVTLRRVRLHDLVWEPYAGDTPLSLARVRQAGWNTTPIREFRKAGDRGAKASAFFGTRSQEQLSCLTIQQVRNVVIEDLHIKGCRARFAEGDIPWQADGLSIGETSSDIRIVDVSIADTWEAIDIVGGGSGVERVMIGKANITDSFNYGIKVGYDTRGIAVTDSTISRAGLAGVLLYGPVKNAQLRRVHIAEPGRLMFAGAAQTPWQQERSGVVLGMGSTAAQAADFPTGVVLEAVTVRGNRECRAGLLNLTPDRPVRANLQARGCAMQSERNQR